MDANKPSSSASESVKRKKKYAHDERPKKLLNPKPCACTCELGTIQLAQEDDDEAFDESLRAMAKRIREEDDK